MATFPLIVNRGEPGSPDLVPTEQRKFPINCTRHGGISVDEARAYLLALCISVIRGQQTNFQNAQHRIPSLKLVG